MPTSVSWIAVTGEAAAALRERMALRGTGEMNSTPAAPLVGLELSSGWNVALAQRLDFADTAPHDQLSAGGSLITCTIDVGRMYSSASGWAGGMRQWYMIHDGEIGIQHFHVDGEPPAEFHPIYNRLVVDQIEAGGLSITVDHVFEVPIELAKALTSFRHDEALADAAMQFERLEADSP